MKKTYFIISLLILLTGCFFDEKNKKNEAIPKPYACFELHNISSGIPSPLLVNKCTGEVWMALKESHEKKPNQVIAGGTYAFYRVPRLEMVNETAGYP